ncbi:hypothetical protein VitviT2T_015285 [Vitis vinifera]|nr:hypothetical protein VitviT2T_015285 [Vitis vinifera]
MQGRPKCFIGPDSTTGPFTFQPKPTSPCLCKFCISDCPTKINGRKCIVFSHPCLPHHPDRRSDTLRLVLSNAFPSVPGPLTHDSRGQPSGLQRGPFRRRASQGSGGDAGAIRVSVGGDDVVYGVGLLQKLPLGEMKGAVPEMKELLRWMTELSRTESGAERAAWVVRNYQSVLTVSNSMLGKLLQEFRQSGALREVVEKLKKEVTEGELLRDCLELVSNDWKGLIQVLNDHLSQSSSDSTSASDHTAEL